MKTTDVPQDDANMLEGKLKEPCYAVDENGEYTTVKSVGWESKNIVMQQAWDNIHDHVETARQQVLGGKRSPLEYYIQKNLMTTKLVAQYTGLWQLCVKMHLNPKRFAKLKQTTLQKYADLFEVSVEELKNIPTKE